MNKSYYFSHDYNARNDSRLLVLRQRSGLEAVGCFWILIEILHESNNLIAYSTQLDKILICSQLGIESLKLDALVDQMIELELLQLNNEGNLSSRRAGQNIEKRNDIRRKCSDAGKRSSSVQQRSTDVQRTFNGCSTDDQRIATNKRKEKKTKENKRKENKEDNTNTNTNTAAIAAEAAAAALAASGPKKITPAKYKQFDENDFSLPYGWGDNAKTALSEWISYKACMGHPKTKTSYQAEIEHYQGSPKVYFELVKRAVREGWRGLNENLPIGQGPSIKTAYGARKSQNILNQEASFAAVRSILNKNKKEKKDDDTRADEFDFM